VNELNPLKLDPAHDVLDFLAPGIDVDMTTCDREPIHLSEAIQPHGVLLAADEKDLIVLRTSANTLEHLGMDPARILGASLTEAVGAELVEQLRQGLHASRTSGSHPFVMTARSGVPYEAMWHRVGGFVVLELEPVASGDRSSVPALLDNVSLALDALQGAEGVEELCDRAAAELWHLTGYDRVMVYRFHNDWHGEVIAERCHPEMDPFLGLHYPASDIPRQARKLYLLNRLRVIADVDYEPVPLLGVPGTDTDRLNLSLSGLRSVSPMHLAYMRNMGVQASLTLSLMHGTHLWGMLACHHRSPRRIEGQLRSACRVFGQMVSLQVVTQEQEEHLAYRTTLAQDEQRLVARLSSAESIATALITGTPSPLALTAADGMVACIDGHTVSIGSVPTPAALELLLGVLCAEEEPSALVCDDLPRRFPELDPFTRYAAGVLALPLSAAYGDFIIWFRGEWVRSMHWAGDPEKPMTAVTSGETGDAASASPGPRSSFAAWTQELRGRSRPWLQAEIDTARALAAAIPDLQLAHARDRLEYLADVTHLAMHDPLTRLPNRTLLFDRLDQALRAHHRDGSPPALLFVDLDHFKSVNDSLGHAAGDAVLCEAAHRIKDCVRDADTVARIGGDEFVVLCRDVTAIQAEDLVDRIEQSFRMPFLVDETHVVVTSSIGVAIAQTDSTAAELLANADTAMYRVKRSGRDISSVFRS
jgi:diguanylate cyclase (GGDEF)-like protein